MGRDVSKGCDANPKGKEIFFSHLSVGYESAEMLKTLGTPHLITQHCMLEDLVHDRPVYIVCPDLLSMVGDTC